MQEGLQEGLQKGEIVKAHADLMRILEFRFGSSIPKDLTTEIAAQRDLDVLDRWLDVALASPDLDAFRAALRERK